MLAKKKSTIFGLPLERRKIDESPATTEAGEIEGFRWPSAFNPSQRSISGTISGMRIIPRLKYVRIEKPATSLVRPPRNSIDRFKQNRANA
jgi:hypothetical protein